MIKLFLRAFAINSFAAAQQQCFANQRFPKVVQHNGSPSATHAEAIIASESLNALFVGGYISQSGFMPSSYPSYSLWAHVGRIQYDTNMWVWSKIFANQSAQLELVTALAINPSNTKVVAHVSELAATGYVLLFFILDAATGAQVSNVLK